MTSRRAGTARAPTVATVATWSVGALLLAGLAAWGPIVVVLGANRLLVSVILCLGVWVSVRRVGVIDLGTGAVAAVGAYAGGVWPAVSGLPPVLGVLVGASAGGAVGALSGSIAGRVGRVASAVTTLAFGAVVVGALVVVPGAGGAAGYHAIPLLTGSDRGDLAGLAIAAAVAAAGAVRVGRRRAAARASVAVRAPQAAAAMGHHPSVSAGRTGAWSGVIVGTGGALLATTAGSVAPATFGLSLSVGLLLAVAVGGAHPAAGALGAVLVFGPAIVWPTVPVLGDAPLLVLGPVGVLILALRPQGLVGPVLGGRAAARAEAPSPAWDPVPLRLEGTPVLDGQVLSLQADPGDVVALVGPNGSGKSTLLARIAGQLDDHGSVRLGGARLQAGPVARARTGIARTFQRSPDVAPDDLVAAARGADGGAEAAAWASGVLGDAAGTPAGAQLVAVASRRPRVALLDEPAAHLDPERVARFCRGLATHGCVVVVVEHRRELVAEADRVVDVTEVTS